MVTQCLGHNQAWSSGINTQSKQLLVLLKLCKMECRRGYILLISRVLASFSCLKGRVD